MTDFFEDRSSGLDSPGYDATPVVPNDGADLAVTSRALYLGSSGDVRVTTAGGTVVTFAAAPVGMLPVRVSRVHATGTTAANIVAVW
ncbi:MAG: hypothetical protein AAF334_00325 [Pseudomonadota bacterium]